VGGHVSIAVSVATCPPTYPPSKIKKDIDSYLEVGVKTNRGYF